MIHSSSLKNALHLFIDKYKIEILFKLIKKDMGFNELKNEIENINPQILSKQLKQLLKDELVSKKTSKATNKKVAYSVTSFGKTLKPIMNSVTKWEKEHKKLITKIKKRNNRDSLYNYY